MRKLVGVVIALILLVIGVQMFRARQVEASGPEKAQLEAQLKVQGREIDQLRRLVSWKEGQGRALNEAYRKDVVDRFHQIFYDSQGWELNQWLGIKTQQNPNDVWITQEIISQTKPDFVVETGTLKGGSALLWATILEQVNPSGRVITVDIEDMSADARKLPLAKKIDFLIGSSTAPSIIADVRKKVGSGKALVILDSDHHKDHVLRELELYSPLVPVNGYLIVQDSNVNGHPVQKEYGPGPGEAIQDFLAQHPNFVQDRQLGERLLFTMHPGGFLRRVS